jgi:ketosteroid isomerase-like protein
MIHGLLVGMAGLLMFQAQHDTSSLLDSERSFAAKAVAWGSDSAFFFALAPDAIVFRPGPVNGPRWIREHPGPPSGRLVWEPSAGAVASAGDLGFTTGPWTYSDTTHTDRPARFGHFVSLWKRQDNGEWKVVLDIGIGHPERSANAVRGRFDRVHWGTGPSGRNGEKQSSVLLKTEEDLVLAMDRAGSRKPLLARIAPDAVLYRTGEPPITDREKIRKAVETPMQPYYWKPATATVSASGDLAYSYGSYVAGNEKGHYLRIWRLSREGEWLIVVDLTNPSM